MVNFITLSLYDFMTSLKHHAGRAFPYLAEEKCVRLPGNKIGEKLNT